MNYLQSDTLVCVCEQVDFAGEMSSTARLNTAVVAFEELKNEFNKKTPDDAVCGKILNKLKVRSVKCHSYEMLAASLGEGADFFFSFPFFSFRRCSCFSLSSACCPL